VTADAHPAPASAEPDERTRVSTLELFFDLVFVFTITQLTQLFADELNRVGTVRVLVMLCVIWWMYGAYAWLTNSVAPNSPLRRGLLLVGMGGFLAIALAIPQAFGAAGWLFGAGYFVVNAVHTGVFAIAGGESVVRALRGGLAWLNLTTACLVLAGGILTGPWRLALWIAAMALLIVTPFVTPIVGFSIAPAHFVERHGLVVIIALGESIIAIGVGLEGMRLTAAVVAAAVLALTVIYFMYWVYFGVDEELAERALHETADQRLRVRRAVLAFGFAHIPLLFAIIAFSAGVKKIIGHPLEHAKPSYAFALGGGAALYLLAHAWFRRILRLGSVRHALLCTALVLATVPLGLVSGMAQLGGTIVAFLVAWLTAGDPARAPRAVAEQT
jgi:low temperature requirement protein LtrA